MREVLTVVSLVFFVSTPAFAQGPLPNQLSLGFGVVEDRQPKQNSPTVVLSFAFADSGNDYWPSRFGFVFEAELGPTSDLEPCQARNASSGNSPDCSDAAVLVGLRFHAFRRSGRRVLPFVDLLLGSYWKASGVEDPDYLSANFAFQGGGGVDLRRRASAHGLRLSFDYRRVVATNANRNQFRFVTSYVLGPPESRSPSP